MTVSVPHSSDSFLPSAMAIFPSSPFYPLLQLSPANPLDSYALEQALRNLEEKTGMHVNEILDSFPAAITLLSLHQPMPNSLASHIEACLLAQYRSEHRCKLWYVLNELRVEDEDE